MVAPTSDRLKLFISYSRRDMAAADALVEKLEAEGFEVTIDRRDLPYGEEWQAELADFIRAADTVVWLVSPASVESRWCNWELGEVQRLNKRLVPVRIGDVAPEDLPENLGRIHILPAEGVFDADTHFDDLTTALNTDRSWLKEHTRLGDRARQWAAKEKRGDLLLRGSALSDAESWRDKQPKAAPQPSDDILDLILASRRAHGRRQRITVAGSLAVALIAIALSGVALWQRNEAQEQTRIAEAQTELADRQREIAEVNEARAVEQEEIAVREADRARTAEELAEQRAVEAEAARQQAQDALDQATETANGIVFNLAQEFRDLGLPTSVANEILGQARRLQDALSEHAADNPDLLGSRAAALGMIGDAYIAQGRSEEAIAVYEEALKIRRSISEMRPDDALATFNLTVAMELIGSYRRRVGNDAEALTAYQESLGLRRQLAKDNPDQPVLRSGLTSSLVVVGDLKLAVGDVPGAMAAYREADALRADLVRDYPDNGNLKYRLALSKARIAKILLETGNFQAAYEAFQTSNDLLETIVAENEANTAWKFEVVGSRVSLAGAAYALGNTDQAISLLESALVSIDDLIESDPENATWAIRRRDVLVRLGQAHAIKGDRATAVRVLEEALHLAESLLAADQSNTKLIRDTSDNMAYLASVLLEQGEHDRGLAELERSSEMMRGLIESDPDNAVWLTELAEQLPQLGDAYLIASRPDDAVAAYSEALNLARRLAQHDAESIEPRIRIIVSLVRLAAQSKGEVQRGYYGEALEIAEALANQGKLIPSRASWPDRLRTDLARSYGNSAWEALLEGKFVGAEELSRKGLALAPVEAWIYGNLAHALLLQGDISSANEIYLGRQGQGMNGQSWEDLVVTDFNALREAGLDHPHMAVVEAVFAENGAAR